MLLIQLRIIPRLTGISLKWLDFVLSQPKLPQSISTSYADDEQTGTFSIIRRFCDEEVSDIFLQCPRASRSVSVTALPSWVSFGPHGSLNSELIVHIHSGARGTSLMFSSGDGGVGDGEEDPALQECFTNDGRNATRFVPLFPPSCPLSVCLLAICPPNMSLTHFREQRHRCRRHYSRS